LAPPPEGAGASLDAALERMVQGVRALALDAPAVVGIHTGGVWVAQHLCARLGWDAPATLDASFYRDDLARAGLPARVRASTLPDLDGRAVLLVDDVLYTGRTVRAALGVLFDYGRPAQVRLAVLVDRGGRELPVCADVTGMTLPLGPHERIKVAGPDPLRLERGPAP
jgi:pyrimidine operon attenuation protein / uracil phosphoribosyltransferase